MLTFSCEPPDPLCLICSYMLLLAKSQSQVQNLPRFSLLNYILLVLMHQQ